MNKFDFMVLINMYRLIPAYFIVHILPDKENIHLDIKVLEKNCYINQQVKIGYEGVDAPIIGDGVRVCAGAKVVGRCTVGNNAIIGANAVVVKNVPPSVTVGGVPAIIIKYHNRILENE